MTDTEENKRENYREKNTSQTVQYYTREDLTGPIPEEKPENPLIELRRQRDRKRE